MADTNSTQILATIIAALFTSVSTIAAAYFGARYAAKLTVGETKRQFEEGLSSTRRQDAIAINARINTILAALEMSIITVDRLKTVPHDKTSIVISTNTVNSELCAKIAALDDHSTRAIDSYQSYLESATRFENTHFQVNWDETRDTQSSWSATLWLQAWTVKKAVAKSVGLAPPRKPLGWQLKLRWMRWKLPSKWKRDGGL